jgi:CotH kinase protein/Secretion system C-terminal sorting domain
MKKLLFAFLLFPVFALANAGDSLFNSNQVHEVRIQFSEPNWWDTLTHYYDLTQQQNQDYYLPALVIVDGDTLDSVGVRLKGNASYGHPGTKKSLKLDFNQYIGGQELDGLRSLHLNNSAYDPTMIREKIMLDIFQRHGLPAPRCTFSTVYFNGSYVGLYKMIEPIDKTFLQNRFTDNQGNLFKGDPYGTLEWQGPNQSAYYGSYELKTNEAQNDWSDLVDLISRINNSGAGFPQQIQAKLDVDQYLKALAINNLFANLDSYLDNPHNYYLYHDSTSADLFHWISWDVGLAFGVFPTWWGARSKAIDVFHLPNSPDRVPLNVHLFEHAEFKQRYLDFYCRLLNEDFNPSILFPKIDSLANRIRTQVYAEPASNRMYSTDQFEGNLGYNSYQAWILSDIPGLKKFVGDRRSDLSQQLCELGWSCAFGNAAVAYTPPGIQVYPVPSSGIITVFFQSPDENLAVFYRITDLSGRTVFEENARLSSGNYSREIDFTAEASGMYILRIIGACGDLEKKIIIIPER